MITATYYKLYHAYIDVRGTKQHIINLKKNVKFLAQKPQIFNYMTQPKCHTLLTCSCSNLEKELFLLVVVLAELVLGTLPREGVFPGAMKLGKLCGGSSVRSVETSWHSL